MRCIRILLFVTFASDGVMLAQSTRSVIVGAVTDQTGAAVPAAEVTISNENTNIATKTTTSTEGQFAVTNLEPGTYRVIVSAKGFKTGNTHGVVINVNQTTRVDVKLDVGDIAATVEVEATASFVQSETSSVGSVVDSKQIEKIPLNGRADIYALLAGAPGIQRSQQNPVIPGATWFGSTNLTIDGVSNLDVGNERLGPTVPSLESIAEFKVITNAASAEFGRGGAQIVVATKAGTNELHGSLFAYNRNRVLSAKNFFATGLPKPPFNRNEFGGSAGGPILKDKLFFFGTYEGLRRRAPVTSVTQQPTAALKSGNFAGLAAIRDPQTGQPFNNNQIPSNRISSVAQELLKYTSEPNTATTAAAGLGNNFTYNSPTRESNDRYSIRIDSQLTSKDRITGRFFRVDNGPFVSAVGGATDKFGNWGGFGSANRNVQTAYTRLLSTSLINEVRFGLTHINYFRTPQNFTLDPSTFIPGLISPVENLGGLPVVNINGFRGFFDQPGSGDRQRNWELFEVLSWARNRHTIKTGFEFQRISSFNFQNPAPARGQFNFDGRYTGHPFGDFLLGATSGTTRVTKNLEVEPQNSRYGAFFQDDWNIAPKLTLNLGVRWEMEGLFDNGRGDLANFYPDLGKIVLLRGPRDPRFASLPIVNGSDVGLSPSNYLNTDKNNFAPRIGFAYRPLGSSRFVVRAGYGIFIA
jgi:outer membrane receptor protein involved in Fe transport